jgi:cell division protease FtsH
MVTEYGMSKNLGPRTYGRKEELVFLGKEISEQRNYGDKVANLIDDEIQVLIQQCYQVAKDILTQHLDRLEKLTRQLMESETLDREELDKLFAGLPGHTASPVTKGRVRRKASTPRSKKTVAGKLNKKPTLQPAS